MIALLLIDIILYKFTLFPSFLFLTNIDKNNLLFVILGGIIIDFLLGVWFFNLFILVVLFFLNKFFLKRKLLFKDYYKKNFWTLVFYFSCGFWIYNDGFMKFLVLLILTIGFNSIWWIYGYRLRNSNI